MRFLPVLALAVLAASAWAQEDTGYHGGTVEVVLYAHIYDLLDALPMNAHPMPPEAPDLARGYTEPTVAPQYGAAFNRLRFFNSMGPVEYNNSVAQPRIHPEQGLALDLELDASKDVLLHWYMSADALEVQRLGAEPLLHAGAVPHLVVRAEVRLGNDLRTDLAAGELVARGETLVDLVTLPGQDGAQEIVVNLGKPLMDVIPAREGFNLGVEWFQVEAQGEQVLAPGWNLRTGAAWPNRLALPVRNPLYLYFVEPQFQGDRVAINAAFNSPLGNYDVDTGTLHLAIEGPGGFTARTLSEPVTVQQTFAHNEHQVAALQGWLWDYKADGAPPGNYTVTVHGSNLQRTATAEKRAAFTLEEEGQAGVALDSEGEQVITKQQLEEQDPAPRKAPGPGAAALAGFAVLAALGRRRQGS